MSGPTDNENPFSSGTTTTFYGLDPASAEAQEIREQDEDLDRMSEILENLKEIYLAKKREAGKTTTPFLFFFFFLFFF